eukprot:3889066-Amphidinium_carterae.2
MDPHNDKSLLGLQHLAWSLAASEKAIESPNASRKQLLLSIAHICISCDACDATRVTSRDLCPRLSEWVCFKVTLFT